MTNISLNRDLILAVVASENAVAKRKAKNSVNRAKNNFARLDSYAAIAVEIADPKKFPRNLKEDAKNLFDARVSNEIKRQLQQAGVTASQAKYFYRHSADIVRELSLNANATVTQVKEFLLANNINSEAKLKAHFSGDRNKSAYDKLLDKSIGRRTKTGKISTEAAILETLGDIERFYTDMKARFIEAHLV